MKKLLVAITALFALAGCKKDDTKSVTDNEKKEVLKNYAAIVHASYEDSYNKVVELKTAINTFTANPTAAGLEACKAAWKASRLPYGQTEAYRFYEGPIDSEDGPEGLINAWPMDESYVDYISTDATTGIINDPISFPVITKEILKGANENGSETNIATGFHAIEFLLWGQDLSATGAGTRPYTDYIFALGGTALNQTRRATYLKVAVDLLADNLASLLAEWKTGGAYYTKFTATINVDSAMSYIIKGIGELSKGELAGERMTVALENKDQEDEHSCFSDNTHIDIQMNFKGIENVYTGTYTRTDGTTIKGKSLSDIIGKLNITKNAATLAQLADAKVKVLAIPAPFDAQIVNDEGGKVLSAITSLRLAADKIADGALAIGVTISF